MHTPWRITKVWQKFTYVLGVDAVLWGITFTLRTWALDQRTWPYAAIVGVFNLAYVLVAVRTFRGYLEPIDPPRAWWRWTGRPTIGYWIAAVQLLAVFGAVQELWLPGPHPPELATTIINAGVSTFLAAGYLNSSIRLRSHSEIWSQWRSKKTTKADPSTPVSQGP